MAFQRTGRRRYAVEIRRDDGVVLRMDPAPGFDDWCPHDLQHLVVEEQLGIADGIYGRLARGGTAATFHVVAPAGAPRRSTARERRRTARRHGPLGGAGADDLARSERATLPAWIDWSTHADDPGVRASGTQLATAAAAVVESMSDAERTAFRAALPRIRARLDEVVRAWRSTAVGGSMSVRWAPPVVSRRR